jgi:hypothetical protein
MNNPDKLMMKINKISKLLRKKLKEAMNIINK